MRIKKEYPLTNIGIKESLNFYKYLRKEYNSISQPFSQPEIMFLSNKICLWYEF